MILLIYELKGSNRGWELDKSLVYIQTNWSYFAGFGLLPTLIAFGMDLIATGFLEKFLKLILLSFIYPLVRLSYIH